MKELVEPAATADGDEFSQMFWDTAGESLQTQIIEHTVSTREQQQATDAKNNGVLEIARAACAPDSMRCLSLVAHHLEALENYWLHFHE